MIKRYEIYGGVIVEDSAGDWCCDWDVCELEQENEKLKQELEVLREKVCGVCAYTEIWRVCANGEVYPLCDKKWQWNGRELKGDVK